MAESARRGRERHSERKPSRFLGRTNGQFTSVSRCDLGGDVKAQSESLPAGVGIPSKKGSNSLSIAFSGIGSPEFATQSSNSSCLVSPCTTFIWVDQPMWLDSGNSNKSSICFALKPPLSLVVDVARGRAHQHPLAEQARSAFCSEDPDRAADGMPNEDSILQSGLAPDLDDIVGIARQARILVSVVGAEVRAARSDLIKQDRASLSKAGATNRHIFWSQPKPWANIIAFSPLPPKSSSPGSGPGLRRRVG